MGDCPVHYRIFSNAHGLDPPDANSIPPSLVKNKNDILILPNIPWGKKLFPVQCHCPKSNLGNLNY